MKYLVLRWDDDTSDWFVFYFGTSRRKSNSKFKAACKLFDDVRLVELNTLDYQGMHP